MYKKFNLCLIIMSIVLLIGFAAINIIIDPYFQYHLPLWGMEPVVNDERYQNPGIAEHFDYDTILVGSSMSENFKVSELNELFDCNSVKLTYAATRTGNMNYMFEKAFATHDIKSVFLGLDIDPLFANPGSYYFSLPEYLYDNNIFNDVNYVLNKSVLLDASANQVYLNMTNSVPDIDMAYNWNEDAVFSKEQVMNSVTWDILERKESIAHPEYISNAQVNLHNNIIKHIESNPDTTFNIFYPPYNIMWWNMRMNEGDLEAILELVQYTSEELLKFDNVKLFGMQNITPLVTELDHYKDYNHYNSNVNSDILKWMKEDQYRLTSTNLESYIDDLTKLVTEYPYEEYLR